MDSGERFTRKEKLRAASGKMTSSSVRISDKISRWKNLIIKKRTAQNEPLIDTYQDIVNYAIIAQMVEKGQWKK